MAKRALISVFEKDNIVTFAKGLVELGWEIISTGGTYKKLKEADLPVIEVDEITRFKEILDGRVKTLHPFIHGGILFRRDEASHVETVQKLEIGSIDMVVNNLYPFEKVLGKKGATHEELIENIDIGGPSMIRAAAKNYKDVIVVTDVHDYQEIIEKLRAGDLDESDRLRLSAKAFNYTAYYDSLISSYFNQVLGDEFPERLTVTYQKAQTLRYGENPHQHAAYYSDVFEGVHKMSDFEQLHGKELSYNNFTDMYSAIKMVKEFEEPCVVGVKHNNPSGLGVGNTIDEAFDKAYACDPVSIFGGIFAINRTVTKHIAEVAGSFFVEIIVAPDFEAEAFSILSQKKNIRLIKMPHFHAFTLPAKTSKETLGGIVYQDYDSLIFGEELKCVTKVEPTQQQRKDLLFGFKAVKTVSSNGIVIVKDGATLGIGQGEVRRSWAAEEALQRAKERFGDLEGAILASDAFFFEDTVELMKQYGIAAVIQPGGSVKDQNVIELCNEHGIAMVFTGVRHFRH